MFVHQWVSIFVSAECLPCQFDQDGTPHFAVNVIAPNQSAKRVAFGPVGSMNVVMTSYCLRILRQHATDVIQFYSFNQWQI